MMTRQTVASLFLLNFLLLSQVAQAGVSGKPVVTLGTYYLDENKPNQKITLQVSGSAQVSGMNFNLQIGDGGPMVGGTPGPVFTGLDLVSNTIFQSDHQPPINLDTTHNPQELNWDIVTLNDGDLVAADGLLATVTIDTTGYTNGESFPLLISATRNGSTNFLYSDGSQVPAVLTNGTILIVPEPSTFAILASGGLFLCGWAGRRAVRGLLESRR